MISETGLHFFFSWVHFVDQIVVDNYLTRVLILGIHVFVSETMLQLPQI